MRSQLAIGLITGGFGLLGVMVGGWISTREARRKEARQDERRYLTAARLVADDLHHAEAILAATTPGIQVAIAIDHLTPSHWAEYRNDLLPVLSDGQWLDVSIAFSKITSMRAVVEDRQEWPLAIEHRALAEEYSTAVARAIEQLPSESPNSRRRRQQTMEMGWTLEPRQPPGSAPDFEMASTQDEPTRGGIAGGERTRRPLIGASPVPGSNGWGLASLAHACAWGASPFEHSQRRTLDGPRCRRRSPRALARSRVTANE